jgi:hypothetical protein
MLYQGFCRVRVSAIRRQTLFQSGLFLFCVVILLCCFLPKHTTAQTRDTTTKEKTFVPIESMMQTPASTSATRSTQATMTKSPVLALALSIVPGLGQFYVESYWKVPIFFGGFGTAVGFTVYNSIQFAKANDLYNAIDLTSTIGTRDILLRQREIYRDLRDVSIVAMVGVIGLAAIDAYVGAHLFDFDVSDEFKASLQLDPFRQRINLAIRWEAPKTKNYESEIMNYEQQNSLQASKP